jgi:hypothetical protein
MLERGVDLVVEFVAVDGASAPASASGIASLDHEVGDDTVKYYAVVVATLREGGKVLAGFGGVIVIEFDCDGALMFLVVALWRILLD